MALVLSKQCARWQASGVPWYRLFGSDTVDPCVVIWTEDNWLPGQGHCVSRSMCSQLAWLGAFLFLLNTLFEHPLRPLRRLRRRTRQYQESQRAGASARRQGSCGPAFHIDLRQCQLLCGRPPGSAGTAGHRTGVQHSHKRCSHLPAWCSSSAFPLYILYASPQPFIARQPFLCAAGVCLGWINSFSCLLCST